MDFKKKLAEVKAIMHTKDEVNIDKIISIIKKKYKEELKDFEYVDKPKKLLNIKKKYIRYVDYNYKIYYGGFLFKTEKIGNKIYLYLVNKDKKIWFIDCNRYYIFINDVISTQDEHLRNEFIKYLLEQEKKN
jgi:hypothetical protein